MPYPRPSRTGVDGWRLPGIGQSVDKRVTRAGRSSRRCERLTPLEPQSCFGDKLLEI